MGKEDVAAWLIALGLIAGGVFLGNWIGKTFIGEETQISANLNGIKTTYFQTKNKGTISFSIDHNTYYLEDTVSPSIVDFENKTLTTKSSGVEVVKIYRYYPVSKERKEVILDENLNQWTELYNQKLSNILNSEKGMVLNSYDEDLERKLLEKDKKQNNNQNYHNPTMLKLNF